MPNVPYANPPGGQARLSAPDRRPARRRSSGTARLCGAALLLLCLGVLAQERISVLDPATVAPLEGWTEKSFKGHTRYVLRTVDGRPALCGDSQGTASALMRRLPVDLARTPYLNWHWRVERKIEPADERSKPGDDFAARVYVLHKAGWLPSSVHAVNFVWAARAAVGSHWPNPYTDRAMMWVRRSAADPAGVWRHERQDIRAAFREAFDLEVDSVQAVAIMVDSDNTGQHAIACFDDIHFTAN